MAMLSNDVYIGSVSNPLYHFSNAEVGHGSLKGVFSVDTIGNELTVDTFSFTVLHTPDGDPIYGRLLPRGADGLRDVFGDLLTLVTGRSGKNYLNDVLFGTPVTWYVNGSFFAKGYAKSVTRIAKNAWSVSCVSGIGLLDTKYHVGGIYRGASLQSVVQSIIGNSFSYSFDAGSGVANASITGHLPHDTARRNLHRVLFATGASMLRGGENNEYVISYLSDTSTQVPDRRIAMSGSVSTELPSNCVEIMEHYYAALPADETVTLYDNTEEYVTADHVLVVFQDPMHDFSASGITVHESGANYAILSGVGTLTGKKYTHIEHLVVLDESNGAAKRVKSVKDNQVVSEANSLNVARRVLDYYKNSRKIRAKIIAQGEKTGSFLELNDPFGEPMKAFLKRSDVMISSVIGANCELVEGFAPGPYGDYFNSYLIVKGSDLVNGTWQVPAAIQGKRARIVLFSGAQGGQGGWYGKGGDQLRGGNFGSFTRRDNGDYYGYGLPGEIQHGFDGGDGGQGGASATRILSLDIASLAASYPVTLGAGGEGGAGGTAVRDSEWLSVITYTPPEDGQPGADSVFNGASTANGSEFGGTYYNIVTGEALAQAGEQGDSGAKGGDGGASLAYRTYNTLADAQNDNYSVDGKGSNGGNFGSYSGGAGVVGESTRTGVDLIINNTQNVFRDLEQLFYRFTLAGGAGGGGAAAGSNGSSGQTGVHRQVAYNQSGVRITFYGAGQEEQFRAEDEIIPSYTYVAFGGDGGDAVLMPSQPIYRGGKGGYGGGGGGGAPQSIGYRQFSFTSGSYYTLGVNYGGKGGNGGKGGKGSDGFFIVYYQS